MTRSRDQLEMSTTIFDREDRRKERERVGPMPKGGGCGVMIVKTRGGREERRKRRGRIQKEADIRLLIKGGRSQVGGRGDFEG